MGGTPPGDCSASRWPKQFKIVPANIQVEKGHGTGLLRLFPSASWQGGRNPKSLYITQQGHGTVCYRATSVRADLTPE